MTDMLEMIRGLGDQLRWAADHDMPDVPSGDEFIFAGMGGSGIAGDYVAAVTETNSVRVVGHKGYAPLPGWVAKTKPLVVGVSYSGNTEETLSVMDAADSAGLDVVTMTTGGRLAEMSDANSWPMVGIPSGIQPRAALGYLFGSALRVVGEASGISDYKADLHEAAEIADDAATEGSDAWNRAEAIAEGLLGRLTIVYGGGVISSTAAQRWKTQINENAKMPAWYSVLPELDHNEIVGWETLPDLTNESLAVVGLSDTSDHPRVSDRYLHTRNLTEAAVPWVDVVPSSGASPVARVISLTVTGDLVSWMLAVKAGVDPVPVGTIEKLKKLLVEDEK